MAAEEAAAAAEEMIGPPPPDMVAEVDMEAGDARTAEVIRILRYERRFSPSTPSSTDVLHCTYAFIGRG